MRLFAKKATVHDRRASKWVREPNTEWTNAKWCQQTSSVVKRAFRLQTANRLKEFQPLWSALYEMWFHFIKSSVDIRYKVPRTLIRLGTVTAHQVEISPVITSYICHYIYPECENDEITILHCIISKIMHIIILRSDKSVSFSRYLHHNKFIREILGYILMYNDMIIRPH